MEIFVPLLEIFVPLLEIFVPLLEIFVPPALVLQARYIIYPKLIVMAISGQAKGELSARLVRL